MHKEPYSREQQGQLISQINDAVKRINDSDYLVSSQSGNGPYRIFATELGWNCSCPDHKFRGVKCKHVYAVEFSLALREKVKEEIIIQPVNSLACGYCGSSNVVKKAIRHNKQHNIQRYLCKECGKRFSFNIGFEKMHSFKDKCFKSKKIKNRMVDFVSDRV